MSQETKIADLYKDIEEAKSYDKLLVLLDQPPPQEWIKTHPYIAGYKYLPIDKVEWLLKKIFKKFSIEILRESAMFNGVVTTVRVHYKDPVSGLMEFHDGIGAKELQVKKGASAADLSMINPGALVIACTIAKTVAIKDACDHFGRLFGSDLNRKEGMELGQDDYLQSKSAIADKLNGEPMPVVKVEPEAIEVNQPETVSNAPLPVAPAAPAPPVDEWSM